MEKWIEIALKHEEWVSTQREAWENWNKPESLGQPAPRFVLLSEQNLWQLVDQLAKYFQEVALRHKEAAKALSQIQKEYLCRDYFSGFSQELLSLNKSPIVEAEHNGSAKPRPDEGGKGGEG